MKVRVIANYQEYRSGAILWLDSKDYERLKKMGIVEEIPESLTEKIANATVEVAKAYDEPPCNKMIAVAPLKKRGRPPRNRVV